MAYEFEYITDEEEARIRRDFDASPGSEIVLRHNRIRSWGGYTGLSIDRGKNFYLFPILRAKHPCAGYNSYVFFFRGMGYGVKVYHNDTRPLQEILGVEVKPGFSCFEVNFPVNSPVPPEEQMEEFQREFTEACLVYMQEYKIPKFSPYFSAPFFMQDNPDFLK